TVRPQNRGSFMSINSAVQQLSAGVAAQVAGLIVVEQADGSLDRYEWVGYLAVVCTVIALLVGRQLRAVDDTKAEPAGVAAARNPATGALVGEAAQAPKE
ncbi:MAG: hypothetical protein WBA12_07465, partial [Catalinimonas sp.]